MQPLPRDPASNEVCTDGWQLTLTLPAEIQAPGTYNLGEHGVEFAQMVRRGMPREGCGGGGCTSGGGGGRVSGGILEVFAVTEDCIAGRIHDLGNAQSSEVDFTGGFVATKCDPTAQ
jgi:hypothetical protein